MADFDERSGIVSCPTSWGLWYQTLDEVSIEMIVDPCVKSRDVQIKISAHQLEVSIGTTQFIKGKLFNTVKAGDMLWTLEAYKDNKVLRIVLPKQDKTLINTWMSLLVDEYIAEDWLFDNMRKKAALEKMSLENPGFDLSGAEITGDYATGGPDVPC